MSRDIPSDPLEFLHNELRYDKSIGRFLDDSTAAWLRELQAHVEHGDKRVVLARPRRYWPSGGAHE